MARMGDVEAPAAPEVAEEETQNRVPEPQQLCEQPQHASAPPEEASQTAAEGHPSGSAAQTSDDVVPTKRQFPWWQLLLALACMAVWCVVLALVMEAHERGFGFTTAWKEGQFWAFLLGLLIASQGLGKIVNPLAYFKDLDPFRVPIPSPVIGVAFIIVELYTGPALCMGALHVDFGALYVIAAIGAILDIMAYFSLSLEAYLRGYAFTWRLKCSREDGKCIRNCTCFGVYGAQKLSIWVLAQDVIVAAETAFVAHRIFTRTTLF